MTFTPVASLSITLEPRVDNELVAPGMPFRALGRRFEHDTAERLREMLTLVAIEERPDLTLPPLEDSTAGFLLGPFSVEEDDVILRMQVTSCSDQPLGTATILAQRMGRDSILTVAREAGW